jgi:hypothetical protein
MHRAGLRARLTLTYAISIVMAVLLTYASYHLTRFPEDGLRMDYPNWVRSRIRASSGGS